MARVAGIPPSNPGAAAHPSAWRPSRELLELHHDLRRPLDAIRALAAEAESQDGVPESVRSCLARITEEAAEVLALCRHVLWGGGPAGTTRVARVARGVASSCRTATGTSIEVRSVDVVVALAEVEVRRALWNLLENAVRAAGPHGRVEVTVEAGDDVRLSVGDSGPGFAAGPKGTASLGLVIVRRLAAAHGGRVDVGRSHLGGALVSLVLPASVVVRRHDAEGGGGPRPHRTPEGREGPETGSHPKSTIPGPLPRVRSVTGQGVGDATLSALLGLA